MDYCLEYQHLTDLNHIYKEISYDELISFFDGFKTGFVMIGGAWCINCQAIIKELNDICKENNIDTIYNYDPRFINVFKEEDDLRKCSTLEHKLKYYALVEKIGFKSTELVVDTLIPKMHVPFFMGIKNGVCVGYYSTELLKDNDILHLADSKENKYEEFKSHIVSIINKLKEERRF